MKSMLKMQDTCYFSKLKKAPPPESLPPTKDALYLHFNRVNYQCRQWKMALNLHHELSDPTDHGWLNDDNGRLEIHWAECKPAPEAILQFVTCSCCKSVGQINVAMSFLI